MFMFRHEPFFPTFGSTRSTTRILDHQKKKSESSEAVILPLSTSLSLSTITITGTNSICKMPQHHVAQQGTKEAPSELNAEVNAEVVAQDQAQMHPNEATRASSSSNLTITSPPTSNDNDIATLQKFVTKQNSSGDVGSKTNHAEACVTSTPPDSSNPEHEDAVNETTTKRDQGKTNE